PVHPSKPPSIHSPALTATPTTARKLVAPIAHVGIRRLPAGDVPARSPFFCGHFLQNLDIKIPLSYQLLQPTVLKLQLAQPLHVNRLERAESLAPGVNRHLTNPVPLGHLGHRRLVRLAQ